MLPPTTNNFGSYGRLKIKLELFKRKKVQQCSVKNYPYSKICYETTLEKKFDLKNLT